VDIAGEFSEAEFSDQRLSRRLVSIATDLAARPADSFPEAAASPAALEATYRFLNNERVAPEQILAPHVRATVARCAERGQVIVAHDTTEVGFSTPREGLGRITDGPEGRGLFLHTSLAVAADGTRQTLGIVGARTHTRHGKPRRKKSRHTETKPEPQRESRRWSKGIEDVHELLGADANAIHVCDREADDYLLFARALACKARFVIRSSHDRRIEGSGYSSKQPTIRHALAGLSARARIDIELSPRDPRVRSKNTSSKGRVARLELCATTVTIRRPTPVPSTRIQVPGSIELNLVHVREIDPPSEFEPVDWKLLTTEPIDTPEQIQLVVDIYDTRWVIEEYFKAFKTGCAIEKRQLESAHSIENALAVFMPIAWSLLQLRNLARHEPTADASIVLTKLQLALLQRHPKARLGTELTIGAAMAAVARLGGHLKSNGPPGWQVLGRGYLKLLALEQGALLAGATDLHL
jgi:hypothetical protein